MDHFQKAEAVFCTNESTRDSWNSNVFSSDIWRTSYESMRNEAGGESGDREVSRSYLDLTGVQIKVPTSVIPHFSNVLFSVSSKQTELVVYFSIKMCKNPSKFVQLLSLARLSVT